MRERAAVLLACALALPCAARAQAADATGAGPGYTLDDALDAMRRAHPLLAAARAAVDAAAADAVDAGLWTNPTLAASWTPGLVQSSYDPAGYFSWMLSQFVELTDVPGARRRAAALLRDATEADLSAAIVDLSLDLEEAFVGAAAARERLRVLTATAAALHEVARVVSERVTAGAAPRYDASRIALTVAAVDADLATASADLVRAEAALRAAIGPGARGLAGTPRFDLFEAPVLPPADALVVRLREARPDLVSLERRAHAAEAAIAVATRSVFSGALVQLGAGYGQSPGQVDLTVGLAFPLPILSFGQGSIPAAEARAESARDEREAVLAPAELELEGAREAADTRRRALEDYLRATRSTDPAMRSEAEAGYLAGRMSVLELADAHAALRDAELRAIDLAVAARLAEIELGRLVGGSLRAGGGESAAADGGAER